MLLKCLVLVSFLTGVLSNEDATNARPLDLETGVDLPLTVETFPDNVVGCYLETPNEGTVEFKPEDKSGDRYELGPGSPFSQCEVTVKSVSEEDNGVWRLYSESDVGAYKEQAFNVTVRGADTDIQAPQQPSEPTYEIRTLDNQEFTSKLGEEVSISIPLVGYRETDSCSVQKPDGQVFDTNDGSGNPGVAAWTGNTISCGIIVSIGSDDVVGDWILIARESSMGAGGVERRQPFSINVAEKVNAVPSGVISIAAGSNFHIRLEQSTDLSSSCQLIGPVASEISRVEPDPANQATCGHIVQNVNTADSGTWRIVYGDKITYTAEVELVVEESTIAATETLSLVKNQPAEVTLGDLSAVYCKLEDPSGFTAFEGFGQCKLVLPRVTSLHAGTWIMHVGLPGKVLTETVRVTVTVTESEPKPTVAVLVEKIDRVVYMTCSISTPAQPRTCKFRSPAGDILLANEGVGEDRYSFHGAGTSQSQGSYHHECGLRITSPAASDLGLWRCAVETDDDVTYYGFLTVLCPWAMMDPAVAAAVVSEPRILPDRPSVHSLQGDEATLSCNVAAPIRYCYFRSQNGSVFPVGPETSSINYVYSGAGFDAGECGIRFSTLGAGDAGRWSCHVGLDDGDEEMKADVTVTVNEKIALYQNDESDGSLVVSGQVYMGQALDYCRFVRMDGFGFTSTSLQSGHHQSITDLSSLPSGLCSIRIAAATILDHHPWTVAARITGHHDEIFGSTEHTINMPAPAPEESGSHEAGPPTIIVYRRYNSGFFFFTVIVPVALALFAVSLLIGPKKNRRWTYERASVVRSSVRESFRSFRKQPVQDSAVIAA